MYKWLFQLHDSKKAPTYPWSIPHESLNPQMKGFFFQRRYWLVATQTFLIFTPKIGEDEPILTHIFQTG